MIAPITGCIPKRTRVNKKKVKATTAFPLYIRAFMRRSINNGHNGGAVGQMPAPPRWDQLCGWKEGTYCKAKMMVLDYENAREKKKLARTQMNYHVANYGVRPLVLPPSHIFSPLPLLLLRQILTSHALQKNSGWFIPQLGPRMPMI